MNSFIDVHLHGYLGPSTQETVRRYLEKAVEKGLERAFVIISPGFGLEWQPFLESHPDYIKPGLAPNQLDAEQTLTDWAEFAQRFGFGDKLLFFVDTRFLVKDVEKNLERLRALPLTGFKVFYFWSGKEENHGVWAKLGLGEEAYKQVQGEVFGYAEAHGIPVQIGRAHV